MWEVGYDLAPHRPKAPDDLPDGEFDVAVLMGRGAGAPPARARRSERWALPSPERLPPERFREVRDLIELRVERLLGRL
jgi:hypothetical protein